MLIVKQHGDVQFGIPPGCSKDEEETIRLSVSCFNFLLPFHMEKIMKGPQFIELIEAHYAMKNWPETITEGTVLPLTPPQMTEQVAEMLRVLKKFAC